jgi:hypothetical protein
VLSIPSNPPRTLPFRPTSSAFIHPDSITSSHTPPAILSSQQAEEALRNFFEASLVPEDDGADEAETKQDENAGVVEGLKVKLMEHQIDGLKFLLEHESTGVPTTNNKNSKTTHGGILADDVYSHYYKLNIDGIRKDDTGFSTHFIKTKTPERKSLHSEVFEGNTLGCSSCPG